MSFSDYQVHEWLKQQSPAYVSLHFDSPLTGGAYASEWQGTGYARAVATFTTPSNRTMWNTNALRFVGLDPGVITWIGGWDAPTSGNLLWAEPLASPVRILAGGGFAIAEGELALSFG